MLGRLSERPTMDSSASPSSKGSFLKKLSLYFLAMTKAFTAAAQTIFGTQEVMKYTTSDPDITSPANILASAINGANSFVFTLSTRSKQMLLPEEPISLSRPTSEEELPSLEAAPDTASIERCGFCRTPSELSSSSISKRIMYCLCVSLVNGSRMFSALASYNGAFVLCKTIVAMTNRGKDPIGTINEDPLKQTLIQIFAFVCFAAQFVSFTKFQLTTTKQYLIDWWLDSEKRDKEIKSHGKFNILLTLKFLTLIASTTFFGIFSTRKGLEHLDSSLINPVLGMDLSQNIIDAIVWFSAACIVCTTTINSVPSTIKYMSKHKEKTHVPLSSTGKILKISGIIDSACTSYATTYSSIITLSGIFKTDQYNPYLIASASLLIGLPNLSYNIVYNTLSIIEKLYPKKSTQPTLSTRLLEDEEFNPHKISKVGSINSPVT